MQFAILLFLLVGCGRGDRPPLGEVFGKITLDGQPLPGATVVFRPVEDGRSSMGHTDAEGRYTLNYIRDIPGAKVGTHTVAVATATEENPEDRIPARYNSPSGLRAEVKRGRNEYDFDLSSSEPGG